MSHKRVIITGFGGLEVLKAVAGLGPILFFGLNSFRKLPNK